MPTHPTSRTATLRLALLAVILAVLAVWLTRWDLPPQPPSIPARAVFTQAQIDRAQAYRDATYLLAPLGLLVPVVVAWLLAWRGIGAGRRMIWCVAIVAGIVVFADLPISLVDHIRAHNVGLDSRSAAGWLLDELEAGLLETVVLTALYMGALPLWRRGRRIGVALAAWAVVAVVTVVQPLAVDPITMSTHPIESPRLQAVVSQLERTMGVHPDSVTIATNTGTGSGENAMADGLGPTERVTIDSTIAGASTAELRALVGHELGHVKRNHLLKGVLWFGVIGVPAILFVLWAAELLCRRYPGAHLGTCAVPVVLALVVTVAALLTPIENLVSRRIEAEADWAGLKATSDPAGLAALQKRLTLANLSNPSPPPWAVWLLFDHPPVMERIAVARAYSSPESGSSSPAPNSGRFLIPWRVFHLE
jgi:STE24 endopeptidase